MLRVKFGLTSYKELPLPWDNIEIEGTGTVSSFIRACDTDVPTLALNISLHLCNNISSRQVLEIMQSYCYHYYLTEIADSMSEGVPSDSGSELGRDSIDHGLR